MRIRILALAVSFLCSSCTQRIEYFPIEPAPIENAVNINKASVEQLETLPYIGRKTAEAIVSYRETNGPFRRPEHLMLIRGISESRFLEIKHGISVR